MPHKNSLDFLEHIYGIIDVRPGITATALAETAGITRDRAKHILRASFERPEVRSEIGMITDWPASPLYVKKYGPRPKGYAAL